MRLCWQQQHCQRRKAAVPTEAAALTARHTRPNRNANPAAAIKPPQARTITRPHCHHRGNMVGTGHRVQETTDETANCTHLRVGLGKGRGQQGKQQECCARGWP